MKITFGLASQHHEAIGRVATTGQVTPGDWPLMRDLAGAINQAWDAATIPPTWPSPPGVAPLDPAQKAALFAAECGVGPQSAFDALTPGMDETTRNVYRQFYGPSAQGWPEVQYWYAHR